MAVILIVDDETLQRDILTTILSDEGYETCSAASGEEALKLAKATEPDIVLTDLKMGKMDGIELLEKLKGLKQPPTVILMTAFGTVDSAVDAMKKGAFDYLTKPLDKEVVLLAIRRALERKELMQRNLELRKALNDLFSIQGIIGHSKAIRDIIHIVRKVSDSPATVLILGESGTGKELIAKAIHYNSGRREKAFMAVNCAAIPETLLESELFGYEPGAFTGATQRKKGLFEAAGGGTVFLDEIGDLPMMTQSKILRVLQEREIMRVGGREPIKVDVRIVSATNKDLHEEMKHNRFREDLFYRLKVVTILMPPLRERREDIPDLAKFFLQKFNHSFGKNILKIDDAAMKAVIGYSWPGNVRELQSVMEKAVLMCESDTIGLGDIRGELRPIPRPALDRDSRRRDRSGGTGEGTPRQGDGQIQQRACQGCAAARHELRRVLVQLEEACTRLSRKPERRQMHPSRGDTRRRNQLRGARERPAAEGHGEGGQRGLQGRKAPEHELPVLCVPMGQVWPEQAPASLMLPGRPRLRTGRLSCT